MLNRPFSDKQLIEMHIKGRNQSEEYLRSRISELETQLSAAMVWEPIENAPRDEERLVTDGFKSCVAAFFEKNGWCLYSSLNGLEKISMLFNPTHFMRIVPPTKGE